MVSDTGSLAISFIYIAVSILACFLLSRKAPAVIARKVLHILSSLWVFVMVYGFESITARILGPALFLVINAVYSYRKGRRIDNGLVAFPLALLIIALLFGYGRVSGENAIASLLILGFGDGAAAVAGYLLGKTGKSVEGSVTMFLVSFIVLLIFSSVSLPFAILAALAAALAERLTPSGLDNLTVPLTSALLLEVICLLR